MATILIERQLSIYPTTTIHSVDVNPHQRQSSVSRYLLGILLYDLDDPVSHPHVSKPSGLCPPSVAPSHDHES